MITLPFATKLLINQTNKQKMRNVEIKAKLSWSSLERVVQLVEQWRIEGHVELTEEFNQSDTFFDVGPGGGRLKLRIESHRPDSTLIAYRRADDSGPKLSQYKMTTIHEPQSFIDAVSLILPVLGTVEKHRTVHIVKAPVSCPIRTRIHLDSLPQVKDTFLELEVLLDDSHTIQQGEQVASEMLALLGIEKQYLITGAYLDLIKGQQ
jgi:adenylate cyclase class IV